MSKFTQLIHELTAHRSSADGLTKAEAYGQSSVKPPSLTAVAHAKGIAESLAASFRRGTLPRDAVGLTKLLAQGLDTLEGHLIDDRDLLLEYVVTLLADLPDTRLNEQITRYLVSTLFGDLPHPPPTRIAQSAAYRAADGSGNNLAQPTLGAARQPYARSVQARGSTIVEPDAGLVFDMLLSRGKSFTPHPAGTSSLLFSHANIIIHDCFNTQAGTGINQNSSYLDLQTIYGTTDAEQAAVRLGSCGLLKPDTFHDSRLALMTPSTTALTVLYARNHNYIARKIYQLNERGAFLPEEQLPEDKRKAQDEEIFQRARLVNCGFYVHVILTDYIPAILGQAGSTSWFLNPLDDMRTVTGERIARATGNHVSAEFSLLYRWHNAISRADEEWLNGLFADALPGRDPASVTLAELGLVQAKRRAQLGGKDPSAWTPHGWQRRADGTFDDAVLARTLMDATEEVAGAFGGRCTPSAMRIIDSLGIQQSRDWALASLNEFRTFLGLEPHKSFKSWNPDPEVAKAAEALYGHIDQLELFPGLVAEQAKPAMPGSGLCPGLTISRAILSDAANLIRGDRFYTQDFTSSALTAWGFGYATNTQPGCAKGVVAKMLFNTLPHYYSESNSVYALFPFVTPARMQQILKKEGNDKKYTFERPPVARKWVEVTSYNAVKKVLTDPANFSVPYAQNIAMLAHTKPTFVMGENDVEQHRRDLKLLHNAFYYEGCDAQVRRHFRDETARLIKENSVRSPTGTYLLDVVRTVVNVVFPRYVADKWAIPLREDLGGHMGITAQELYAMLAAQFANTFATFGDGAPGIRLGLQNAAMQTGDMLHGLIKARVVFLSMPTAVATATNKMTRSLSSRFLTRSKSKDAVPKVERKESGIAMSDDAIRFYKAIIAGSKTVEDATKQLHGLAVGFCVNQAQQLAQIVEFYLRDENAEHLKRVSELARSGDEADDELLGYVYEAMRFCPQSPFIPRYCDSEQVIDDGEGKNVTIHPGMGVWASQQLAMQDPSVFPNPEEVNPHRDLSKYLLFGTGMHICLGKRFADTSLLAASRAIFSLPNLRRAPGPAGQFKRSLADHFGSTRVPVYLSDQGQDWPFPVALSVLYGAAPGTATPAFSRQGSERSILSQGTVSSADFVASPTADVLPLDAPGR